MATQTLLHFAVAMAQRIIPVTPVPIYPGSSQAWIIPSCRAYKPALQKQLRFPGVRRMLVSLQSVGDSDNSSLHDERDDATDITAGEPRSATSSLTSEGSLPQSPQDGCDSSARWVDSDDLPQEEYPTGYVVDPFRELSLTRPSVQHEFIGGFNDKLLASNGEENDVTATEFASFTWVRALGEGGSAATVAVRETSSGNSAGRLLCLKIFVKSSAEKQDLLFGVQRELLAYRSLASADRVDGSAFIMELDGALEDPERIYFAMVSK